MTLMNSLCRLCDVNKRVCNVQSFGRRCRRTSEQGYGGWMPEVQTGNRALVKQDNCFNAGVFGWIFALYVEFTGCS
jgi:hypothetical protein